MLPVEKISSRYTVRRLTEEDLPALLTLCRGNPQYYAPMHTEPALENLRRDMTALPPKKGMEDKYFLGLFQGDALLAVLDLILRYPNPETAFVGWLMLERSLQGGGTGTGIVTDLLDLLREWGFRWVRLGYVKGNPQSRRFWEKNGFAPTGVETDGGGYTIVVMERALCSGTEIGKSLHRKEIAVWQK